MRALLLSLALLAPSVAFAQVCNPNIPNNPENDCDMDGCTVAQGDCADSTTLNPRAAFIRGPSCPSGAASETCDGADNNCNGSTDEGNPGGGGACSTGQMGVCSAGTNTCTGGMIVCQRNTAPGTESCNGLDDDCDGTVDENNPGGGAACSTGQQGICSAGLRQCTG
ncbi:MAG TPA: MopE-related protein, partial [Archangium sp.]